MLDLKYLIHLTPNPPAPSNRIVPDQNKSHLACHIRSSHIQLKCCHNAGDNEAVIEAVLKLS